jgi:hypothetical protein
MIRAASALLPLVAACSFTLQDVHVQHATPQPPECDDGYGYAAVDLLFTGAGAAAFYFVVDCRGEPDCLENTVGGLFLILPPTVAFALSSFYGFRRASQCQDAKENWQTMVGTRPPPPVPGAPEPPPPPPPPPPMK